MNRRILCFLAAVAFVFVSASMSMAENAILASLENQGATMEMMDDTALDSVRGMALLINAPTPSVVHGTKKHHVTWKRFGSQLDYRSYNYIGSGYNYWTNFGMYYEGDAYIPENVYTVAGDQWLADTSSSPDSWNLANSQTFELHGQILYTDGTPSPYALHESLWNRPLTTFIW